MSDDDWETIRGVLVSGLNQGTLTWAQYHNASGKVSLVDYKAADEALWTARRIARNERDGK